MYIPWFHTGFFIGKGNIKSGMEELVGGGGGGGGTLLIKYNVIEYKLHRHILYIHCTIIHVYMHFLLSAMGIWEALGRGQMCVHVSCLSIKI